jgi:hypothetical protein
MAVVFAAALRNQKGLVMKSVNDFDVLEPICGAKDMSASSALPRITLGDLAQNATDGERALLAAGVDLYQQCGRLVRPIVETVTAAKGRKTRVARLFEVDQHYLRDLLSRYALWQSHVTRENKMVRKDPPMDIAKTILARVGEWRFPTISGVISTPTMREDGSLLTAPGYDKASGFILFGAPDMPSIPLNPSRDDALRALTMLEELLVEFPSPTQFRSPSRFPHSSRPSCEAHFQSHQCTPSARLLPAAARAISPTWRRPSPPARRCR